MANKDETFKNAKARYYEKLNEALNSEDRNVICAALRLAAAQYLENKKVMLNIASILRDGGEAPMFASGETGARAADRLAEQFDRQHDDADKLLEKLEE